MGKEINLVLCKHYKDDIVRVFYLPDGEDVRVGDNLICDTAKAKDEKVVAVSDNFTIPDGPGFDRFLCWMGTDRKKLKPITGRIVSTRFSEEEDEEKEDEEEKKKTVEDMLHLVESGIESLTELLKSIRRECPKDSEAVVEALFDINDDLFSANKKAFALDIAVTIGNSLLHSGISDEEEE